MAAPKKKRTYTPPKTVNMTLRIPPELDEHIVAEAAHLNIPKHTLILYVLRERYAQGQDEEKRRA